MYEQEDETQQEDEWIIPSHALRWSRSLTNFHDVEDEDDLSTGKKKSVRTSLRKTNNGGGLGSRVDAPQKPNCRPPRARITNDKGFGSTCPLPSPCARIEEIEKSTLLRNCVSGLCSSPLTDVVVCAICRQEVGKPKGKEPHGLEAKSLTRMQESQEPMMLTPLP